jgi:membrane-associated phospholipid phosphatase
LSWGSLLQTDARWSDTLRVAEKPGPVRTVSMVLAHSGDSWFWGLGLILLYAFGDAFWKQWALTQLVWISLLAALVMGIKFLVRRRRPEGEWGAIYRNTDPHSFPSGHAARAVLIAVIALGLGPLWLGIALAMWAPLVALARVAMGVHYVSDVIAGALTGLIGALVGLQLSPLLFGLIFSAAGLLW